MNEHFFSPCPRGLEPVLVEELTALGARSVESVPGGVGFQGDWALCWRVNLESRVATRVLWRVAQGKYQNENDIYRIANTTPWSKWWSAEQTLRIYLTAIRAPVKSLQFTTLRIKDGVCDYFRVASGKRPDIDTENPDVRIHGFLTVDTCTLYLDTSGEPLYKRGFKQFKVEAPLKENLAAGILKLTGWIPDQPLLDPMCGSGTFLIEAAQIALDVAPGLGRSFAFERLRNFEAAQYKRIRAMIEQRRKRRGEFTIVGADIDAQQVYASKTNLAAAGLDGLVRLEQSDVLAVPAPALQGVWVTNPPYGVRLGSGEELAEWYPKLGDALKKRFAGWRCHFLSADMELAKRIGLKASKRTPLFNGELECRLFAYDIVAGSNRERL